MSVTLWGRPTSARTQKVMLALAELKISYEFTLASSTMGIDGSVAKGSLPFGIVDTPEYLDKNPNGTIPTIDDNGYVLWESNAIVQYLGMKHNPELFYSSNIETFCSASRWMMWENNNLIPPMHKFIEHLVRLPERQRDKKLLIKTRERLVKEFLIVENQLANTKFIAGNHWTMGDIPITVRFHRWNLLEKERPKMPNLEQYYQSVRLRPSFAVIEPEEFHTNA